MCDSIFALLWGVRIDLYIPIGFQLHLAMIFHLRLIWILFSALLVLESLSEPTCFLSPLYPHGEARGDQVARGDDHSVTLDIGTTFPFYGDTHSVMHVSTNGVLGLDADIWDIMPLPHASSNSYIASFHNDASSEEHGRVLYRKVDLDLEEDVKCLVEKDAAAIGEAISPNLVTVVTWKNTGRFGGSELMTVTHQIVLASDGSKTIVVLNYGRVAWAYVDSGIFGQSYSGVSFNRGNSIDWVAFPLSVSADMINIADYSNINHPGRIVTRVDGDIQLPNLTRHTCTSCSIDLLDGGVKTFDGSDDLIANMSDTKFILSKQAQTSDEEQLDQCKFMTRATTNAGGTIVRASFSGGVHPANHKKYKRNFLIERSTSGIVNARGHGMKATAIDSFPYYETIADDCLTLVIEETIGGGWDIHSLTCKYMFSYDATNSKIRLYLGPTYHNKTIGLCQNNNNDVDDEKMMCYPPIDLGDDPDFAEKIAGNCSCASTDSSSCKSQVEW